MNRTRQITIETHSITIIRTSGKTYSARCEQCDETVTAFVPEKVAGFLRLDLTEVCRRIKGGEMHLTETKRGVALVCSNSLGGTHTKYLSK